VHGIVSALKESRLFSSVNIIELIDEESVKLIKARAEVINGTSLHLTELHTASYQKYSYHWQDQNGKLIMRWDNKPHWKDLKTFPHHKHEGDRVLPSHRVGVYDVIETIREVLEKSDPT